MSHVPRPTILLVAPDDAFAYLIERYARRCGYGVDVLRPSLDAGLARTPGPAVIWFSSLQSLDELRPRERGLVSDDAPVIVFASRGDEPRARDLGADHCAIHPLTYREFLAALATVGLPARGGIPVTEGPYQGATPDLRARE